MPVYRAVLCTRVVGRNEVSRRLVEALSDTFIVQLAHISKKNSKPFCFGVWFAEVGGAGEPIRRSALRTGWRDAASGGLRFSGSPRGDVVFHGLRFLGAASVW